MPQLTVRLTLMLGFLTALLAAPAAACGCGAYVPSEGDAHVAQERALIRWDGRSEDIVMALSVEGRSEEAAWILPVPAHATVKLADPKLFEALQTLTRPQERVEYIRGDGAVGGAPGAGAPVTVLERQELGPFDVATLAASDSAALSGWLSANGFVFAPGLQEVLEPYVAQGWEYVAVRLVPQATAEGLSGDLDPLWVTFDSDTLIYPMRATSLAREPLPVFLYVLAEHRVRAAAGVRRIRRNGKPGLVRGQLRAVDRTGVAGAGFTAGGARRSAPVPDQVRNVPSKPRSYRGRFRVLVRRR